MQLKLLGREYYKSSRNGQLPRKHGVPAGLKNEFELTHKCRLNHQIGCIAQSSVEERGGFTDLVGNNTALVSSQPQFVNPSYPVASGRRRWQEMAAQFASYPQLTIEERQHLVTRWYLHQQQKMGRWGEGRWGETSIKKIKTKSNHPAQLLWFSPTQLM